MILMPTVSFRKDVFDKAVGSKLPLEKLAGELEQMKVEVNGVDANGVLSVEVTGDRPDLMSLRGIARALRGKLGVDKGVPKLELGRFSIKIVADKQALKVRPVVVGAVVEGVSLDEMSIAELFQQQEKLDSTIGRARKRVSIGLYDLDALKPPFAFKLAAEDAAFTPLKANGSMTMRQVLEEHPAGREYAHLLRGKYPVLEDSAGEVLSLVPVINNASSAVTPSTRRLFIDHTGSDRHACNASLNILCQDFFDAGCKVSKVAVEHPDGAKATITPDNSLQEMSFSASACNKLLGSSFKPPEIVSFLARQRIGAKAVGDRLDCSIPAYRYDFLHPVDLVEEVALGFGYLNFKPVVPSFFTRGSLNAETLEENACRDFMVGAGFTETLQYVLSSPARAAKSLSQGEMVEILNPVSGDYAAARGALLPGLLELLSKNTHYPYPQRVFEVGPVIVPDSLLPEKMRTQTRLACVSCHASSSLTEVASVLAEFAGRFKRKLSLSKLSSRQFLEGRQAEVLLDGKPVGSAGEVHPQVLENHGLQVPAAAFEIILG